MQVGAVMDKTAQSGGLYRDILKGSEPLDPGRAAAAASLHAMCCETIARLEVTDQHVQILWDRICQLQTQVAVLNGRALQQIRYRISLLDGGEW